MGPQQMRAACQEACDSLNSAYAADPAAMHALSAFRFPCNDELAEHPDVVVERIPVLPEKPYWSVGTIGLLAGVFRAMGFPCTIATRWSLEADAEGRRKFLGFSLVEFAEVRPELPAPEPPAE